MWTKKQKKKKSQRGNKKEKNALTKSEPGGDAGTVTYNPGFEGCIRAANAEMAGGRWQRGNSGIR